MKTFFCIILILITGVADSQNGYKLITKMMKQINKEISAKNLDKALSIALKADSLYIEEGEDVNSEYVFLKRITGYIYAGLGRKAEAESNYREAMDLYLGIPYQFDPEYIITTNEYALLLMEEGRYAEAEPSLLEAIEYQRSEKHMKAPEYAYTLSSLGNLYYKTGRYIEAESKLKDAISIGAYKTGEFKEDYAQSLDLLADIELETENSLAAIDFYKTALKEYKKIYGEKSTDYAYSLAKLGDAFIKLSQFSAAEPLYKEAINIEKTAGRVKTEDYAFFLNEKAVLFREKSEYDAALSLHKEALSIQKAGGYDVSDTYFNLAQLYTLMADYSSAEEIALRYISSGEMSGKNGTEYLTWINLLGNLYTLTGNYIKAEKIYKEIIEKEKKMNGEVRSDYAVDLDNLANLYRVTGKPELARPLIMKALEIKKKNLGEISVEVAYSLNNLASISRIEGKYQEAESSQKNATELYRKCLGEENSDFAGSLIDLASIYIAEKRYHDAEPLLRRSIEIVNKTNGENHPLCNSAFRILAGLYESTGKADSAEILYLKVNRNLHFQIQDNFSYLVEKEKEAFISTFTHDFSRFNSFIYSRKLNNPALTGIAYDNQLALKGIVLQSSKAFRQAILNSNDNILIDEYSKLSASHTLLIEQQQLPVSQRWVNTDSLESISVEQEKNLNMKMKKIPGFNGISGFENVRWTDVQNELSENEAAIEFVSFDANSDNNETIIYCALLLRKGMKYPEMIKLFNESDLKKFIDKNKSGNDATTADRLYRFSQSDQGKNLYDIIWKPIDNYLGGVEKIYYSAAGLLNTISFDAIPVNADKYLSDKYKLIAMTSTREIIKKSDESLHTTDSQKAVFYGGINYDSDTSKLRSGLQRSANTGSLHRTRFIENDLLRGSGFQFLEGTLSEVQTIESLFNKKNIPAMIFSGDDATEESLKNLNNLNSPVCLHIATHGFFFPRQTNLSESGSVSENSYRSADNPLFRSGLILAGGNHVWKNQVIPPDLEDGILLASEVTEMYLPNTQLVVLSACETGLGDIEGSEGVFGLQRSFKMTGARFLIYSLWQVPDYQTSELMNKFYEGWLKGQLIHDAFRNAQSFMKTKYQGIPSDWAAFVLVE